MIGLYMYTVLIALLLACKVDLARQTRISPLPIPAPCPLRIYPSCAPLPQSSLLAESGASILGSTWGHGKAPPQQPMNKEILVGSKREVCAWKSKGEIVSPVTKPSLCLPISLFDSWCLSFCLSSAAALWSPS